MKVAVSCILAFAVVIGLVANNARADYVVKSGEAIAFMGDSTTVHGNQPDGYIGLFLYAMERLGVKDIKKIPAGVSGNTSADMVKRFKAWTLDYKPNIVTINCGVNDVWSRTGKPNVSLEDYRKNVLKMVDDTIAAGVTPVLVTPSIVFEDLDNVFNRNLVDYVKCMHEIAADRKIAIADVNKAMHEDLAVLREAVKDDPKMRGVNLLTNDGVHMKYEGNKAMAWGLLKGFGVTDAQRDDVEQFWREMPMLGVKVLLTREEYDALKDKAGGKEKMGVALREQMVGAGILGK